MDKNARFIKPLKTDSTPGLFVVLDSETLPEWDEAARTGFHRLRLGVAIAWRVEAGKVSRRRVFRFTTADELWEWLYPRLKPRQPTWLFAHNLGFDLTVCKFWERLESGEYGFTREDVGLENRPDNKGTGRGWSGFICAEDPPTIISLVHKTGGRLTMVDTLNYFRVPLAELGQSIGLEKLPFPEWTDDDDIWFDYCQRDSEILEATVLGLMSWWKTEKLGVFRYTAASLAMEAFRRRFLTRWIELHDNHEVKTLEREAYYGGRLELFYQGKVTSGSRITEVDVNGLYAHMMSENRFPYALADYDLSGEGLPLRNLTANHIAEVLINTHSDGFPYRCGLGLLFPTGEYWTTLCGPELLRAARQGCIAQVGRWARYKMYPLFTDFVQYFSDLRLKYKTAGDSMREQFTKLMQNSLYGKFGQRYGKWKMLPGEMPIQSWGEWFTYSQSSNTLQKYRGIGHLCQVETERGEHSRAFPAISAFVTSYGREYMRNLLRIAGTGHVYYMVTDSLVVDSFGLDNLRRQGMLDELEPGKLKIQHQSRTAQFDGLHWWRLGKKEKRGSLKPDAVETSQHEYEQERFTGLREMLKSKSSPPPGVHTRKQVYRFRLNHDRGLPDDLGWLTPLVMDLNPINEKWERKPTAS